MRDTLQCVTRCKLFVVFFNNNIYCDRILMKIVAATKESPNHKLYMRYKDGPMNGLVRSRWKVPKGRKC